MLTYIQLETVGNISHCNPRQRLRRKYILCSSNSPIVGVHAATDGAYIWSFVIQCKIQVRPSRDGDVKGYAASRTCCKRISIAESDKPLVPGMSASTVESSPNIFMPDDHETDAVVDVTSRVSLDVRAASVPKSEASQCTRTPFPTWLSLCLPHSQYTHSVFHTSSVLTK